MTEQVEYTYSSMTPGLIASIAERVERPASSCMGSTPENAAAASALIVAESSRLCVAAFGHEACAIVLTGSMSRGEATLKREGAIWRVLGDATFLIVFERPTRVCVKELERKIEGDLLALGISCKIVVVTATTANLRKMKPHIYAYELRERGVVVWGEKTTLGLIPQFTAADIPREDGWWLLCNRMIEQLESAALANTWVDDCAALRYRIAKLYLAMSACYLLVIGCYEPSYQDRAKRLQELARSHESPPAPIPLQRFAAVVSQCTDLKLHGEPAGGLQKFPRWRDAVSDAEASWRWALSRILVLNPGLSRKELLAAMAARQPIVARAKGWLRAAYVHPSGLRRYWLRQAHLACSMSPRYLVYDAAAELFFKSPGPDAVTPVELSALLAKLPISPASSEQLSWRAVAKLVAHNFHVLLEATRC